MSSPASDPPQIATPSLAGRLAAAAYDPVLWLAERRGLAAARAALLREASGRVLEIGAGTGLNLGHYPAGLDELVLTEPVSGMAARLARSAAGQRPEPPRIVQAPAEQLPFPDERFDTVVGTLVLCTVRDPAAAIAEVRRLLAPGGRLLFIEHVRADEPHLARWQDRLVRPWAAFAAGCRCNQPTLDLMRAGGLRLHDVEQRRWRAMPPIVRPVVIGRAG